LKFETLGAGDQNPRPFDFAQGRLCLSKERRDEDGAPLYTLFPVVEIFAK